MKIDKDTKICISVASKPGNFGALVHNYCYEKFGLNQIYIPLSTDDFDSTMFWVADTPSVVGCSVSMPYKKEAIRYTINDLEFDNINTIYKKKNDKRQHLWGASTDLFAIEECFILNWIDGIESACILGDGAMASNFAKKLTEFDCKKFITLNKEQINNFKFENKHALVINATPVGMDNDYFENKEIDKLIDNANVLIDCPVLLDGETEFIKRAKKTECMFITTGLELSIMQASRQVEIYTDKQISGREAYHTILECLNDYRTKKI